MKSFTIAGSQLAMGASLGNSAIWIHTKADGAIERIFLNSIGESLVGTVNVRYAGRPERVDPFFSGLFAVGPRVVEIHPAYQRVRFSLVEAIDVVETTFVPFAKGDPGDDEPLVYVMVELENRDTVRHDLRVIASAMLRGSTPADVRARYDGGARELVAENASRSAMDSRYRRIRNPGEVRRRLRLRAVIRSNVSRRAERGHLGDGRPHRAAPMELRSRAVRAPPLLVCRRASMPKASRTRSSDTAACRCRRGARAHHRIARTDRSCKSSAHARSDDQSGRAVE